MKKMFILICSLLLASCSQNKNIQHFEAHLSPSQSQTYNQGVLTLRSDIDKTSVIIAIDPDEIEKNQGVKINVTIINLDDSSLIFDPEKITHELKTTDGFVIPVNVLHYKELMAEAGSIGGGWAAALQGFGAGVSDDPLDKIRFDLQMEERARTRELALTRVEKTVIRISTIESLNSYSGFYKIDTFDIRKGQTTILKITIPIKKTEHDFNIILGRQP